MRNRGITRIDVKRHPLAGHLARVADLASRLARSGGGDPGKARLAGLLHDWLKPLPPGRLARVAKRLGLVLDPATRGIPELWHGPVAAELAKSELGIRDEEVLEAVRWHATGRPGLGITGLAVFTADYCEEGRKFPEAAEGRRRALKSLAEGARYVSASKLAWLASEGAKPHPISMAFNRSLLTALALPRREALHGR
jgi:predicted HD superfamily hydrolase involved in NAD metabolism